MGARELEVRRNFLAFWTDDMGGQILFPLSRILLSPRSGYSAHFLHRRTRADPSALSASYLSWRDGKIVFASTEADKEWRIQVVGGM